MDKPRDARLLVGLRCEQQLLPFQAVSILFEPGDTVELVARSDEQPDVHQAPELPRCLDEDIRRDLTHQQ